MPEKINTASHRDENRLVYTSLQLHPLIGLISISTNKSPEPSWELKSASIGIFHESERSLFYFALKLRSRRNTVQLSNCNNQMGKIQSSATVGKDHHSNLQLLFLISH